MTKFSSTISTYTYTHHFNSFMLCHKFVHSATCLSSWNTLPPELKNSSLSHDSSPAGKKQFVHIKLCISAAVIIFLSLDCVAHKYCCCYQCRFLFIVYPLLWSCPHVEQPTAVYHIVTVTVDFQATFKDLLVCYFVLMALPLVVSFFLSLYTEHVIVFVSVTSPCSFMLN